jgi:hypothetical protein
VLASFAVGTSIAGFHGNMSRKNHICTLNLKVGTTPAPDCPTRQRLSTAFARLQNIQLVRNHRGDPSFGKSAEDRLIWRELLELELHDIDQQIERILESHG